MKDVTTELLKAKIDWQKVSDSPPVFETQFQNKSIRLRLNDFPEEVLCTLFVDDDEVDLDDFPSNWTLPRHREKR